VANATECSSQICEAARAMGITVASTRPKGDWASALPKAAEISEASSPNSQFILSGCYQRPICSHVYLSSSIKVLVLSATKYCMSRSIRLTIARWQFNLHATNCACAVKTVSGNVDLVVPKTEPGGAKYL
jgi:hypothetical protein